MADYSLELDGKLASREAERAEQEAREAALAEQAAREAKASPSPAPTPSPEPAGLPSPSPAPAPEESAVPAPTPAASPEPASPASESLPLGLWLVLGALLLLAVPILRHAFLTRRRQRRARR